MNSDTPRTDAAEIGYRDKQRVPADFARQLERENKILRDALKNAVELTKPEINHLLGLLETNERTQEYTAPCEQYWKRHLRIKNKLLSA